MRPWSFFYPLGLFWRTRACLTENGIRLKVLRFLDRHDKINYVVMDRTGTVTKGVFKIQDLATKSDLYEVNS